MINTSQHYHIQQEISYASRLPVQTRDLHSPHPITDSSWATAADILQSDSIAETLLNILDNLCAFRQQNNAATRLSYS